mgnify:FL=1|jgi:hypothetical protein|tara:strand:+ start:588 stop:1178 length:591 start_codon:yes stop_codon:yes gene_type:complete
MTSNKPLFRHPLLHLINPTGNFEEFSVSRKESSDARIKSVIQQFKEDGVDFKSGGRNAVVELGKLLFEYESALQHTAALFKLDHSLKGLELSNAIHRKVISKARDQIKQGIGTEDANKARKISLSTENLGYVVQAFLELYDSDGKYPGDTKCATRAKQMMSKAGVQKADRDLLTRHRVSEIIAKIKRLLEESSQTT